MIACDVNKIAKELSTNHGITEEEALKIVQTQINFMNSVEKSNAISSNLSFGNFVNESLVKETEPVQQEEPTKQEEPNDDGKPENIETSYEISDYASIYVRKTKKHPQYDKNETYDNEEDLYDIEDYSKNPNGTVTFTPSGWSYPLTISKHSMKNYKQTWEVSGFSEGDLFNPTLMMKEKVTKEGNGYIKYNVLDNNTNAKTLEVYAKPFENYNDIEDLQPYNLLATYNPGLETNTWTVTEPITGVSLGIFADNRQNLIKQLRANYLKGTYSDIGTAIKAFNKSVEPIRLDEKSGSLLVPVYVSPKIYNGLDMEGFDKKDEHHVTLLGFPQGKEIKKILEKNPEKEAEINALIDESNLSFNVNKSIGNFYNIKRDREAWVDWKDKTKGKTTIHEEAIIKELNTYKTNQFITKLNALLGTDFPKPYTHVSLATKGTKFGIGIADKKAFLELDKEKLTKKNNEQYQKESKEKNISEDPELFKQIQDRLLELYPEIKAEQVKAVYDKHGNEVLGKALESGVQYSENASLDTLPHEYAHVYLDLFEHTVYVNNLIKRTMKTEDLNRNDAKEHIVSKMGEEFVKSSKKKNRTSFEKMIAKLWNMIKHSFDDFAKVYRKFSNKAALKYDIEKFSREFYQGKNKDAVRFEPDEGYSRMNAEETFALNETGSAVFGKLSDIEPSIVLTGSVALSAQGDVYRKGKGDLHDLDILIPNGTKGMRAKLKKAYPDAIQVYDFVADGLDIEGNDIQKPIQTFIIPPAGTEIINLTKQYGRRGKVTSYELRNKQSKKEVGTYRARHQYGKTTEKYTGQKSVMVDLMFRHKNEGDISSVAFESDTLGKTINLASAQHIFNAKRYLNTKTPRAKDVKDYNLFNNEGNLDQEALLNTLGSNSIDTIRQGSDNTQGTLFNEDAGDVIDDAVEVDFTQASVEFIYNQFYAQDADTTSGQTLDIKTPEFIANTNNILRTMDKAFADGAINNKISYVEIRTALEESMRGTSGYIEHDSNGSSTINLRWNENHGTARKSEIFLHEMVHFMTRKAFALSPDVQIVIKELQKTVRESGLDYNVFLQDIKAQGLEPTSYDIQIAKDKWNYTISKNADPEEFFAYVSTNESLFNAVKDLKIQPEILEYIDIKPGEKGLLVSFSKVINSLIKVINKTWASLAGAGNKNAAYIINDTMNKLVTLQAQLDAEEAIAQERAIDGSFEDDGIIKDFDEKLKPWVDKFDTQVESLQQKIKEKKPLAKIVESAKKISIINRAIESNVWQYIVTSVTKKTNDKKWAHLYRLYRIGKNFTEKHRKGLSDAVGSVVEPYFENVDESTRKAITTILFNNDIPSLLKEGVEFKDIKESIADDNKLEALYDKAMNDMVDAYRKAMPKASSAYIKRKIKDDIEQAESLALHLNDGEIHTSNQQLNANNIYKGFYNSGVELPNGSVHEMDIDDTTSPEAENAIEKLDMFITFSALKSSPKEDRYLVKKYLDDEDNVKNIKSMLEMYNLYVDDAASELSITSYDPIPKGYFENLNKANIKYELIAEDELDYYTGMFGNMTNIGEYGTINGTKYYKMVGRGHEVGFDEGMISIAGTAISGISLKSLLTNQLSEANRKKHRDEKESLKTIDETVTGMMDTFIKSGGSDTSILNGEFGQSPIPVYDFLGNVIDYKIQPNRYDRVKHMKYNLDVVESSQYTFSKLQHRQASVIHNKEVVDELLKYGQKHIIENPDDFMILKRREEGEKYDENKHGRWDRIPDYTRHYIFRQTGKHEIVIPKDMMEMITGERGVTFSNMNVGKIDLRNSPKTQKMILAIEDYIKEISGWLKETIAIRLGSTVAGNTISNMMQAWIHGGIDPIEYTKKARRKWQELNDYRELLAEADKARVQLAGQGENKSRKTLQELKILEQRIEKNPFHALVQDGQFSPIIEDINIDDDTELTHLSQMIEKGFNSNRFTQSVKPIKEFLFMDRNTKAYKAMMKFTQYGDIITREILRETKIEKAKKAGKPLSPEEEQEYLDFLDQLFVNYSYIDNRFVRYAERILAVFYTKYFLRQAKAMQSVISLNPGRYSTMVGTEMLTGIDVQTAEDAYFDPIASLLQKLGFLHPSDIVDSLTDVPIMNIMPRASSFYR